MDYANKVGAVIIFDAAYEAYIAQEDVPHSIYECDGARTCAIAVSYTHLAVILKWLKNFYRRFFQQQFKRSCLPDGPKVGSVAVSPRGDLRMPSDACATLWLEQVEAL